MLQASLSIEINKSSVYACACVSILYNIVTQAINRLDFFLKICKLGVFSLRPLASIYSSLRQSYMEAIMVAIIDCLFTEYCWKIKPIRQWYMLGNSVISTEI